MYTSPASLLHTDAGSVRLLPSCLSRVSHFFFFHFLIPGRRLKGQCNETCFRFSFTNHFPPKPSKITIGSLRIFSKIRGNIRMSRCTTGINDAGGNFCHRHRCCRWYRRQIGILIHEKTLSWKSHGPVSKYLLHCSWSVSFLIWITDPDPDPAVCFYPNFFFFMKYMKSFVLNDSNRWLIFYWMFPPLRGSKIIKNNFIFTYFVFLFRYVLNMGYIEEIDLTGFDEDINDWARNSQEWKKLHHLLKETVAWDFPMSNFPLIFPTNVWYILSS